MTSPHRAVCPSCQRPHPDLRETALDKAELGDLVVILVDLADQSDLADDDPFDRGFGKGVRMVADILSRHIRKATL